MGCRDGFLQVVEASTVVHHRRSSQGRAKSPVSGRLDQVWRPCTASFQIVVEALFQVLCFRSGHQSLNSATSGVDGLMRLPKRAEFGAALWRLRGGGSQDITLRKLA